jgi:hypothetical protein
MAGGQAREPLSDIAEWAGRYLERLDQPFDAWETDCFRRGCSFLARGVAAGAASSWRALTLPPDRRDEARSGPLAARRLTAEEIDRFRAMLERLVRRRDGADDEPRER